MFRVQLLVGAIALTCATTAFADEIVAPERLFFPDRDTAVERFQWFGEENVYGIRILGSEAVRAGIEIGPLSRDAEFGPVIAMRIIGTTVGFFDTIYPINNEALTLVSPELGLLPVYTDSDFNERDYVTRLLITYDREAHEHHTLRIAPDTPDETRVTASPIEVYDDLSMIFDVRSRDLSQGNGYVYYTHDGDEFARITITSLGTEEIFTELFGYVDCYKLAWVIEPLESAPMLPFGDVALPPTYRAVGEVQNVALSYFTADAERIMIGGDIETSLGLMTIRLIEYRAPAQAEVQP